MTVLQNIFPALIFFIGNYTVYAQQGIYRCVSYEFKDENDPSKNVVEADVKILNLDFNSEANPHVTLTINNSATEPQDIVLKWNIKSNMGIIPSANENIVKTTFTIRKETMGVEETDLLYLYKTEDMVTKTLDIVIYDPKLKTSRCFYGLIKQ